MFMTLLYIHFLDLTKYKKYEIYIKSRTGTQSHTLAPEVIVSLVGPERRTFGTPLWGKFKKKIK